MAVAMIGQVRACCPAFEGRRRPGSEYSRIAHRLPGNCLTAGESNRQTFRQTLMPSTRLRLIE